MTDAQPGDGWAIFSKVNHRLQLLDSPDPAGWTVDELATEYNCSARWMRNILHRLVRQGYALDCGERYIGSGKTGVGH